jgi:hypothetical protein
MRKENKELSLQLKNLIKKKIRQLLNGYAFVISGKSFHCSEI